MAANSPRETDRADLRAKRYTAALSYSSPAFRASDTSTMTIDRI